jgi:hypothetical protein
MRSVGINVGYVPEAAIYCAGIGRLTLVQLLSATAQAPSCQDFEFRTL